MTTIARNRINTLLGGMLIIAALAAMMFFQEHEESHPVYSPENGVLIVKTMCSGDCLDQNFRQIDRTTIQFVSDRGAKFVAPTGTFISPDGSYEFQLLVTKTTPDRAVPLLKGQQIEGGLLTFKFL